MKTYLEKILPHPENPELSVIFKALEDDVDLSTHDFYMEESVVDEIQLKFHSGNKAAWFTAHVTVCKKGDEENLQHAHGEDFLGGCSYHTFEDFLKSEQFQDMVKEATSDMNKNQETVASSPSWHELTEHAIVFGTDEQFKMAQEHDSEYNEGAAFLPCIIEDKGYSPNEMYPDFDMSQCDDGSYEQMVDEGEIEPDEIDKETFLMDCLKSLLEDTWSPELAPPEKEVEEETTEASTPIMTVRDLEDNLKYVQAESGAIIHVRNDGTGSVYNVCQVKTVNGYTTIIAGRCEPKDAYDYLGLGQVLSHFNGSSEVVVLLDNPVEKGEFLITGVEDMGEEIVIHVEDSRSLAKVHASETVSWEEILPDVLVYGTSLQVECAIQDGDLPLEIPSIAHGKGFEPLSESPDYSIEDFLKGLDSSEDSRMAQMKLLLEKSYNPEAYSSYVEAEVEKEEELKDYAVAGPGAGVTLEFHSFRVPFKKVGDILKFEPVLVNVDFYSAYDKQTAEEGLSVQFDDVSDPEEVEVLLNRYGFSKNDEEGGEVHISAGPVMTPKSRRLVLSPGWSRAQYKAGDIFEFADDDNWLKGTATFTEYGEYAWADLDEVDEEAEGSTGKKTVASGKCLTHTFSDAVFDFDLEGVEDEGFIPPKYDIEVEQCFEYESDYGADADGNRGMATWFFGDRGILNIIKDGERVDLKSEEGKKLLDRIENDKDFERMVEKHDWNLSSDI